MQIFFSSIKSFPHNKKTIFTQKILFHLKFIFYTFPLTFPHKYSTRSTVTPTLIIYKRENFHSQMKNHFLHVFFRFSLLMCVTIVEEKNRKLKIKRWSADKEENWKFAHSFSHVVVVFLHYFSFSVEKR